MFFCLFIFLEIGVFPSDLKSDYDAGAVCCASDFRVGRNICISEFGCLCILYVTNNLFDDISGTVTNFYLGKSVLRIG